MGRLKNYILNTDAEQPAGPMNTHELTPTHPFEPDDIAGRSHKPGDVAEHPK